MGHIASLRLTLHNPPSPQAFVAVIQKLGWHFVDSSFGYSILDTIGEYDNFSIASESDASVYAIFDEALLAKKIVQFQPLVWGDGDASIGLQFDQSGEILIFIDRGGPIVADSGGYADCSWYLARILPAFCHQLLRIEWVDEV